MYTLTEEQIDYIRNKIEIEGIESEGLKSSLLDHICCLIENKFTYDQNFESVVNEIITQFYKTGLRGIESDIALLINFKNSNVMKFLLTLTGLISSALFLTGSFFKIINWQEPATICIYLAFIIAIIVLLPLLGIVKAKERKLNSEKLLIYCGTVVGILYLISMFLLLKHSSLASELWLITLFISLFVFTPAFYFTGIKKPGLKFNTSIITILIVVFIGIQFSLTNLRQKKDDDLKLPIAQSIKVISKH
ncbi:MAG: hypothetical protein ACJ748_13230 [Flavisolibacter sp.]